MIKSNCALALILIFGQLWTLPVEVYAQSEDTAAPTAAQLKQLVAPIALYPDALVAQILAASTYPTQVVEAARWVQSNPGLTGQALVTAVDQQAWDPSVKALTAFPSVLNNMNNNLSWTSALGAAYYSVPQDVMKTIQLLRAQARAAGNLNTTSQQIVTEQGSTIIIQPANPQVVYLPEYNPTVVYGAPVAVYPGYSSTDLALTGLLAFGAGVAVGALASGGGGWGWNSWGCNWSHNTVIYNHNTWVSGSNTFWNNNHNWNTAYNNWQHSNWNNNNWNRNNWNNNNWNKNNTNWNKNNNNWNKNNNNWNKTQNNWNKTQNNWNKNNNNWNKTQNNLAKNNAGNWNKNNAGNWNKTAFNGANKGAWNQADRGFGKSSGASTRSNAFGGGFKPGGNAFAESARGRSSFGGFKGRR